MVSIAFGTAWGLLLLAAVGYVGIAVRVARHEDFPGRPSFLGTCLLLALFLGALTVLMVLSRLDAAPVVQILVLVLTFAAGLTVPLAWVRFALQFTGQRFPTGRRTFIRLGLPVVATLLVIVATLTIGFLSFGLGLFEVESTVFAVLPVIQDYSVALTAFYLAALLVVGASLIAWTSYSFSHLSNKGGVLLGLGVLIPWIAIVLTEVAGLFTDQPLLQTAHATLGAILGVGAVWWAVDRHDLFGTVPAAGTVGRDITVEEMNDPVLVTDGAGRVIDLNAAAEEAFQASTATIGRPLRTVVDATIRPDDLEASSGGVGEVTRGSRTYESTASVLRDEYGRLLGHSFVFHDVTERKRREQRIQVLNRVLRHNLRNDLNVVKGHAELLEGQETDPEAVATEIQSVVTDLIAIGEKAREVQELVAGERDRRPAPLSAAVETAVDETQSSAPACAIQVDPADDDEPVAAAMLTAVLRELLENACRHNDASQPWVELRTDIDAARDYPIRVEVADNGPGIPAHELAPIRAGTETALEHGSGLGLWLVEWGVTAMGGRVEFADNDPPGTVATVWLRPAS